MKFHCSLLALATAAIFALPTSAALAKAAATVEAVQAPAWLDRNGKTQPLAVGMELKNGDVLRTGEGARTYLLLAEGSRVKLAESARFSFFSSSLRPERQFRGAIDVAQGAFRYTTNALNKLGNSQLAIRVGTATVGIRGTDLWGRSISEGELVALLSGRIDVSRGGETTELAQPMTYFDAPTGQASTVKVLQPELFNVLSRQTEILPGDGAARSKGKWTLLAATTSSQDAALEVYDALREAGFAARISPRPDILTGKTWDYDVLLAGFSSEDEANVAAKTLKAKTGIVARSVK